MRAFYKQYDKVTFLLSENGHINLTSSSFTVVPPGGYICVILAKSGKIINYRNTDGCCVIGVFIGRRSGDDNDRSKN